MVRCTQARYEYIALCSRLALDMGQRGLPDHVAGRRSAGGQAESSGLHVLKITSASGRSALFTADIEVDVERELLARNRNALRTDVLIVPHHGSRISSTELFLDAVGPLAAILKVDYRNRFHHPNPAVCVCAISRCHAAMTTARRVSKSARKSRSSVSGKHTRTTHTHYLDDPKHRIRETRLKDIIHFSHANGFPASTYRTIFAELADDY